MTPYTKQIVELHKIHKAIENCGCNKDEQGGGDNEDTGLTGNLVNDWVIAVTQGEYTKYEDVPEADAEGLLNGWRRATATYTPAYDSNSSAIDTTLSLVDSFYELLKDATFESVILDGGPK